MSESKTIPLRPTIVFSNPRGLATSTPLEKAQREIEKLRQDPELQYNAVFGRPRNEADRAEEERRNTLYRSKVAAILKKYDVVEEYLSPLLRKRERLWNELATLCNEIEQLRS